MEAKGVFNVARKDSAMVLYRVSAFYRLMKNTPYRIGGKNVRCIDKSEQIF